MEQGPLLAVTPGKTPVRPWKRPLKVVLTALGIFLLLYVGIGFLLYRGRPKGYIWIFSDGCYGSVRVTFEAQGEPALPTEDGYDVIRVPQSGVVRTSSVLRTSDTRNEYFYERDGRRVEGPVPISGVTEQRTEGGYPTFTDHSFFGTPEQLADAVRDDRQLPPGLRGCRAGTPRR